jgi:hypothetical protein
MSQPIVAIKTVHNQHVRRFTPPTNFSFAELLQQATSRFALSGSVVLRYKDDELVMCTIASDDELREAIRLAALATPPVLRVQITVEVETPNHTVAELGVGPAFQDTNTTWELGVDAAVVQRVKTSITPAWELTNGPSPARMSSMHATDLASLTSEVRRIDELMKELAAKKATLLAAIAGCKDALRTLRRCWMVWTRLASPSRPASLSDLKWEFADLGLPSTVRKPSAAAGTIARRLRLRLQLSRELRFYVRL